MHNSSNFSSSFNSANEASSRRRLSGLTTCEIKISMEVTILAAIVIVALVLGLAYVLRH